MQQYTDIQNRNLEFQRTTRALKAARLLKGLSRKDAAKLLGWKVVSFEQIENGRCNFSKERLHKILEAYGYSLKEFERVKLDPKLAMASICQAGKADQSVDRKPRRNHYKIVTKEVRVIRILRKRKGISQYEASRLCGLVPGGFGHIEVGRIELKADRIRHILACLGYSWIEFEQLMKASVLRDEIIDDAALILKKLDDQSLISATNVIKALQK